jgi:serine phosphatase RsbU (regulator of sigma subunit)
VSIGDVCGKGARAAARTGQVREVLRVLVREGHPPARVLELLNDVMMEAQDPHQFCTIALAMVTEPAAGRAPGLSVELVLAGHDQPVLVHAAGGAELVGRHGTAAGLVNDFVVYPTHHMLAPGDVLVTYTDGITERRRGTEEFGHDRLVATMARAAGGTAAGIVSTLRLAVDEFSSAGQRDDIAVMAIGAPPRDGGSAVPPLAKRIALA